MLTLESSSSAAVEAPLRASATGAHLEESLATAFPPIDAPEDALVRLADSPADARLLAILPTPQLILLEELLRAVASARIVIVQRVGVPLAMLISVGTAVMLHLLMVGGFLLAGYMGFIHPRGLGNAVRPGSEGGSGDGYMIIGEAPPGPPVFAGSVDNLLSHAPQTPPMPALPDAFSVELPVVAAPRLPLPPAEAEIIGMASGETLVGRPKPSARTSVSPTATLVVAPPTNNVVSKTPKATGAFPGRTGNSASSPRGGVGDGGGNDEGPLLSLFKEGRGGLGGGKGNRIGNGIDRGESGANNPNPSVLDAPSLQLPDEFGRNPPRENAVFEVTVLPSGKPGAITLLQSCGVPDVDVLCRANIQRYKFRPAYLAGKPIEKSMTVTQNFKALN